ncbi:MAG: glutamate--cysteine ligase [Nannocystaceae bacterium]
MSTDNAQSTPPLRRSQLIQDLASSVKPEAADHLIGTELETHGLVVASHTPVNYPDHIRRVLEGFCQRFGWKPSDDRGTNGEVIALQRERASITLEPGGQLELSGKPLPTVHATCGEFSEYRQDLDVIAKDLGLTFLATGFHPLATLADMNHTPKGRYRVMRAYLPTRGGRALDMMHRTCTLQANFDFASEAQCGQRLRTAIGLSALSTALFASSPFFEGQATDYASQRSQVWTDVDPDRCGLLPFVLDGEFSFARYVDWALTVPMFFVRRGGHYHAHHKTFATFLREGFVDPEGNRHQATEADFRLHLNTLFPEARLNPFIEVRGSDAVPARFVCALPALWKGLLYDDEACAASWGLVANLDMAGRLDLWRECREASLRSPRVLELCRQLLEISRKSLQRQGVLDAKGRDESHFLDPLDECVAQGISPADLARQTYQAATAEGLPPAQAIRRAMFFAGVPA